MNAQSLQVAVINVIQFMILNINQYYRMGQYKSAFLETNAEYRYDI